jgi:hypothetical protein
MDNIFIQDIAKAYVSDKKIQSLLVPELYEYAIAVRNSVKSETPLLLEEIKSETRLYQQKILYRLFDHYYCYKYNDSEFITEDFGIISGGLVAAALMAVGIIIGAETDTVKAAIYRTFTKSLFNIRDAFIKNKIIKGIDDRSKKHELMLSMLDEEYSTCARRCGIDPKKTTDLNDVMNQFHNLNRRGLGNDELSGPQCLISCTLDYLTSSFAELSKVYKSCLIKTGEDPSAINMTGDPLSAIPTGSACHDIRSELDDVYKKFKKMLDVLFEKQPQLRSMWINIMNQKIKDAMSDKAVKNYSPRNAQFDLKAQLLPTGG